MSQWSLQFESTQIKNLQEEMMSALSNIYNALKEVEEEKEYLSGIWKGEAADTFFSSQNEIWHEIGACAEKSEKLLAGLIEAETEFALGEKEIQSVVKESILWGI